MKFIINLYRRFFKPSGSLMTKREQKRYVKEDWDYDWD